MATNKNSAEKEAKKQAFARLLALLKENGIKPPELYKRLDVEYPSQTWNNWKSRGLPLDQIETVCNLIHNLSYEYLAIGKGPKFRDANDKIVMALPVNNHDKIKDVNSPLSERISYAQFKQGEVPLLTALEAVDWESSIENQKLNKDLIMIPIKNQALSHTFATAVTGDSMEPEFIVGEIVIVEPALTPEHKDYVLVNIDGDACIRQYWREAGEWLLKPVNSRYLPKPLGQSEIIGVVREKTKLYR